MSVEMKDSGIAWIGEIPKHWEVIPFKAIYSLGKGLSITKADLVEQGVPVVSYGQIHSKQNTGTSIKDSLIRYVPESCLKEGKQSLVSYGDVIFADTSEDREGCGNCVFVDRNYTLFAGYHTIVAKNISDYKNNYFSYLFQTDCWRLQIRALVNGVKLFSISQKLLSTTTLILPPIEEQSRIANFLDKKCAEIDELIALQEQMIAQLNTYKQAVITETVTKGLDPNVKMKDSGVEWIGEIPEHWEISRVGIHHNIILGKMLCNTPSDDSYTLESYYCAANVHFDGVDDTELKKMWFSPKEKSLYKVNENDLLVVEGGAGAGGCAIVTNIKEPIYVQNSIMIVRPKTGNITYLKYLLESLVKKGYIDIVCNKATIPHFTKDKLSNVPYPVISLAEQQSIAQYLNQKCKVIDELISIKKEKIEQLKAYKKSVIYEYVTGKKQVSDN